MKPYTTNPQRFEWFCHRDSILPFTFRTFVKAFIVTVIVIVATLVCCSCGSTKVTTQIVRDVHTDTVYMANQQYDSIYIYKDLLTDHSRDTIYIKDNWWNTGIRCSTTPSESALNVVEVIQFLMKLLS